MKEEAFKQLKACPLCNKEVDGFDPVYAHVVWIPEGAGFYVDEVTRCIGYEMNPCGCYASDVYITKAI